LLEKDFFVAAEKVNRDEEEFRFQQLKKDYVNELKHKLQMSAQELMNRNGLTDTTGQEFTDFIKEYLHRYVQKINAY
jgi:protein associated with RNAse G/E